MPWRIAAASIDGVLITEHFGRAKCFYIIDISRNGSFKIVERRAADPLCQCGHHSDSGMAALVDTLKDCVAVLAAVIGPPARKQLELAGLSVFEEPAKIEGAAAKLAAYYVRTNKPEAAAGNSNSKFNH